MGPLSAITGVAGSVLGALPSGASLGDMSAAPSNAVPSLSGTAEDDGLSDEQYIDLLAVIGAGSSQQQLLALWKANRNKVYMDPRWLSFFAERGLVSNPASPTKADKQFVTMFSLVVSASQLPARKVEETWLVNREAEALRSTNNLNLFRGAWGVIG